MPCCPNTLTEIERLHSAYWDEIYELMADKIDNVSNLECFGRADEANKEIDGMNDFFYLFTYLFTIYLSNLETVRNRNTVPGPCPDQDEIMAASWDHYMMACIVSYFKCKHDVNIRRILTLFGLSPEALTGIDHMTIRPGGPCDIIFTVK